MKRYKRLIFILTVLLPAMSGYAGVSFVMNNNFEADGYIGYVSPTNHPYWWDEVSIPSSVFSCSVDDNWASMGDYSLVFLAMPFKVYTAGQKATVSQKVYLEDVNTISFELLLTGEEEWDLSKVTAFMAIDGNNIWVSNEPDPWGNFETVSVPDYYKDAESHSLTVGIRCNVSEMLWESYEVYWDFIRFDTHCDGLGHHPWDINLDCNVDMDDIYSLVESWLVDTTEVVCRADVFEDELTAVNFKDYADVMCHLGVTSYIWDISSWPEIFVDDFDFNFNGIVDMSDVIGKVVSSWLEEGPGLEADYNHDEIVNFEDYAFAVNKFGGKLGTRDSLYGW